MHRRVSSSAFALFLVVGLTATQAFAKTEKKAAEETDESADEQSAAGESAAQSSITKAPAASPSKGKASDGALPPPPEPLKIDSSSGTTIKFGILLQPMYEASSRRPVDMKGWGQDLFVHRLRFMVGGTLLNEFDYYLSTDYPDLFKQVNTVDSTGTPVYLKNFPGMSILDAFVTYRPVGDVFKVDVGYMLPPMAHNAIQGAGTLYGWDYFANTFLHKNSFGTVINPKVFNPNANPLGRDVGLQLRGLLFHGLVEYRAGVFQGRREPPGGINPDMPTAPGGRNSFRLTGRIQLNLLDPETGFFYSGTYLGTKRVLSLGASGDFQASYKYWAYDVLLDLPLGPGIVTAQANIAQWDPGSWLAVNPPTQPYALLVKQRALMAEAGYLISAIRLSPIFRFEQLWIPSADAGQPTATEKKYSGGLAFWPRGHNVNLKAFFTHSIPTIADTHQYDAFNFQWQIYFF